MFAMFDFLRGNRPISSATLVCSVLLAQGLLASAAAGADLQTDIADAQADAGVGNFIAAFSRGIATLEAYPESEWDEAVLRRFITEVVQRWHHRMTVSEQQAVLPSLGGVESPGARWAKTFALWRAKQRTQALAELMPLIRDHPDSVGAEFAIRGLLIAQWSVLGDVGTSAAVKAVVDAAPNNPSTGWALCRVTWRYGQGNKARLARKLYDEVIASKPDTRAASVAGDLKAMLDGIEAGDYATASEKLSAVSGYLTESTGPASVIATLFLGIDWDQPEANQIRITSLRQVFGQMADTHTDSMHRCFGFAVLGFIEEKTGNRDKAIEQYQRMADEGDLVLSSYGWRRVAQLCYRKDPARAVAALEEFRRQEAVAGITGSESAYFLLGRLYLEQKQYAKAEEIHRWLLDQQAAGQFLNETQQQEEELRAGLAGALFGQGREAEARTVIDPVLAKYRYGLAVEQHTRDELRALGWLLKLAGRQDESQAVYDEYNRR